MLQQGLKVSKGLVWIGPRCAIVRSIVASLQLVSREALLLLSKYIPLLPVHTEWTLSQMSSFETQASILESTLAHVIQPLYQ